MPTIAEVFITDWPNSPSYPWTEISDPIYADLREGLFRSRQWDSELLSMLPQTPVDLLYQIPLAFVRARNPLTQLGIHLVSTTDHKLGLRRELLDDLANAAEILEALEINCELILRADKSGGLARVSDLVCLLLKGGNLRSVTICFGYSFPLEHSHMCGSGSLAPLFSLLSWVNLRRICFLHCYFEFDETNEHFDKLKPGSCIVLQNVHLLSGSWADLLDVIRAKADGDSEVLAVRFAEAEAVTDEFMQNF